MVLALGDDLDGIWAAPSTTDKDRKQLLHTLLDEATTTITTEGTSRRADLRIRWKGGAISELTVPLKRAQPKIRTDDDTIELIGRLAVHHSEHGHRRDPQPTRPTHRSRTVIHRQ